MEKNNPFTLSVICHRDHLVEKVTLQPGQDPALVAAEIITEYRGQHCPFTDPKTNSPCCQNLTLFTRVTLPLDALDNPLSAYPIFVQSRRPN